MKVIDLLNKIANGNIPKRIIYDEYVYQWNNIIKNYEREIDINTTLNWDYIAIECLNEEVEVIKDTPKKIEKLDISNFPKRNNSLKKTALKINEIIDKIIGFIRSGHTKNKRKNLETYKLTFADKLYFFFNDDYYKRYGYLFPKVEKHQKQWFREKNIGFPYDFNKYLQSYTENLIFEFSSKYE